MRLLTAFLVSCAAFAPVASGSLIAHYSFDDGTAAEDSDSSLDGTISGATATTGRDGSGALSFDGEDDYVEFPAEVTADILGSAARTLCLWALIDNFDAYTAIFSYIERDERGALLGAFAGPVPVAHGRAVLVAKRRTVARTDGHLHRNHGRRRRVDVRRARRLRDPLGLPRRPERLRDGGHPARRNWGG